MTILWVGENHFGSTLVDGSWVRFLPFPALVCFMILCPCKSNQSLLVCSDFNNSLPLYVHAQVARIKSQKKKKNWVYQGGPSGYISHLSMDHACWSRNLHQQILPCNFSIKSQKNGIKSPQLFNTPLQSFQKHCALLRMERNARCLLDI